MWYPRRLGTIGFILDKKKGTARFEIGKNMREKVLLVLHIMQGIGHEDPILKGEFHLSCEVAIVDDEAFAVAPPEVVEIARTLI